MNSLPVDIFPNCLCSLWRQIQHSFHTPTAIRFNTVPEILSTGTKIYEVIVQKKQKYFIIKLRDSYNLMSTKLEKLPDIFGLSVHDKGYFEEFVHWILTAHNKKYTTIAYARYRGTTFISYTNSYTPSTQHLKFSQRQQKSMKLS
jgi:hypothetical protein